MDGQIISNVRKKAPLIHCITNYVTAGDVANMLLGAGGSPIMADGIHEVEEITAICQGLVINIGTLNERTIEAMIKAGKKAVELGHPVVFDPVGSGASLFRTETANQIIREIPCTVIRGNVSEMKSIAGGMGIGQKTSGTKGVDADERDAVTEENIDSMCSFVKELSAKAGAVIAMTGAIDLIAAPNCVYVIRNGHPLMAKITGTGCMLDALVAAYLCSNPERVQEATAAAVAAEGLCGEWAYQKMTEEGGGTGNFRVHLIDYMSKIDDNKLRGGARIEIR